MTLETEIAIAIMNNRGDYMDYKTGKIYALPTPQTCGTNYQQETYARIKAREIIEKHNLNKYY